jgi:hypothetical protein
MVFLIIITILTFFVIFSIVWGVTGMLIYFFPSLTYRAYRRILIDITFITSFFFGIMLSWSIHEGVYHLQNHALIMGSILLFALSPFSVLIRRKAILVATIWCLICFIWVLIAPIPSEGFIL